MLCQPQVTDSHPDGNLNRSESVPVYSGLSSMLPTRPGLTQVRGARAIHGAEASTSFSGREAGHLPPCGVYPLAGCRTELPLLLKSGGGRYVHSTTGQRRGRVCTVTHAPRVPRRGGRAADGPVPRRGVRSGAAGRAPRSARSGRKRAAAPVCSAASPRRRRRRTSATYAARPRSGPRASDGPCCTDGAAPCNATRGVRAGPPRVRRRPGRSRGPPRSPPLRVCLSTYEARLGGRRARSPGPTIPSPQIPSGGGHAGRGRLPTEVGGGRRGGLRDASECLRRQSRGGVPSRHAAPRDV